MKATPEGNLTQRVVAFARYLKDRGFRVFSSNVTEAMRGLGEVDITRREDFFSALRASLVSCDREWALFGDHFRAFWGGIPCGAGHAAGDQGEAPDPVPAVGGAGEPVRDAAAHPAGSTEAPPERAYFEGAVYSPIPNLERQDLSRVNTGDIQAAHLIMRRMLSLFRITPARRTGKGARPRDIDFRRIASRSLRTGGEPLELFYRRRRRRLKKLVVLADVSGSMERYAGFVLPFILGLRGVGHRAEVFVFSTSLYPVSPYLRKFSLAETLEILSQHVPDWSGGTRIGLSLRAFNEGYGKTLLNRRTVVVILSDGWDLGAKRVLEEEMADLSRKANRVLWLNPHPVDSEGCVLAKGMEIALPYVDHFLSAYSLESLRRVGRTLAAVMAGR